MVVLKDSHKPEKTPRPEPDELKPLRPFRPRVFLMRMLAIIFFAEFIALMLSFRVCTDGNMKGREAEQTITECCPSIGSRSQELFAVAIATTLSLLGSSETPKP